MNEKANIRKLRLFGISSHQFHLSLHRDTRSDDPASSSCPQKVRLRAKTLTKVLMNAENFALLLDMRAAPATIRNRIARRMVLEEMLWRGKRLRETRKKMSAANVGADALQSIPFMLTFLCVTFNSPLCHGCVSLCLILVFSLQRDWNFRRTLISEQRAKMPHGRICRDKAPRWLTLGVSHDDRRTNDWVRRHTRSGTTERRSSDWLRGLRGSIILRGRGHSAIR